MESGSKGFSRKDAGPAKGEPVAALARFFLHTTSFLHLAMLHLGAAALPLRLRFRQQRRGAVASATGFLELYLFIYFFLLAP